MTALSNRNRSRATCVVRNVLEATCLKMYKTVGDINFNDTLYFCHMVALKSSVFFILTAHLYLDAKFLSKLLDLYLINIY